jgi:tetratricopeptide (TPR) repeat protein
MKFRLKYSFISLLFLLCGLKYTEAQEKVPFATYDSVTYALYLQSDWKNLIKTSRDALKENHDYYYLRMRRGIALYEQQKYMAALKNFKKAQDFNFPDPISSEYIYYSYLFSGQRPEALLYWKNNAKFLSPKIADPKKKK